MAKAGWTNEGDHQTTLLIVGKVGNGKSSTGNSILGQRSAFKEAHSFTSNTLEYQVQENNNVKVICTPDLQHIQFSRRGDPTFDPDKEVSSWLKNGQPDAVVLLLRCDQRLTEYESDGYTQLRSLLLDKRRLKDKLVIVFTMGDRLNGRDLRLDLEANERCFESVQEIWKDAGKRYVVFDNTVKDDKQKAQVNALMHIVKTMRPHAFPQHVCRLLVQRDKHQSQEEPPVVFETVEVGGLHVETPDKDPVELTDMLDEASLVAVSPGPHVIMTCFDSDGSTPIALGLMLEKFIMPSGQHVSHKTICKLESSKEKEKRQALEELGLRKFADDKLCGEFFHNPLLEQAATRVCDLTMRKTRSKKGGAVNSYDTYIAVKRELMGDDVPSRCSPM